MVASIDVSREAQLRDIEASFQACNENFSLESLQHPNKPNVTAMESYAVLPDVDIWANQYDLFRFSERPGERQVDVCLFFSLYIDFLNLMLKKINQVDDPRLDCAILRPMKTEHDSFLAFYLTEDDEQALKFKETRFDLSPYEVPESEEVSIMFYTPP
jgi:RNA polymerase II-associated factor 1